MKIPWRWHLPSRPHGGPRAGLHAKLVEVIHAVHPIVASEKENGSAVGRPRGTRPPRRDNTLSRCIGPHAAINVKLKHVIQPGGAIVPSEDEEKILMHGGHVPKACRRHRARVAVRHRSPGIRVKIERVKIVEPSEPRVATEQVHLVPLHHSAVILASCWNRPLGHHLSPSPRGKIKFVEVVQPAAAAISSQDIQGVPVNDSRSSAALAWTNVTD
mmetsp:Transcript_54005/g.143749  ORF Transcript_54005/g.143749 Transcript_54005/m.143749 type:complete len:215 (-) Transcript_54005:97-741(-)